MENWPLSGETLNEPQDELLESPENKEEEEKAKKKKLARLLALMATKKSPKEDWGKKSFIEEISNQQEVLRNKEEAQKEEKRLAELKTRQVIEIAKKFVDERLDFARQELTLAPQGSEKEKIVVEDIEILTEIKEVFAEEVDNKEEEDLLDKIDEDLQPITPVNNIEQVVDKDKPAGMVIGGLDAKPKETNNTPASSHTPSHLNTRTPVHHAPSSPPSINTNRPRNLSSLKDNLPHQTSSSVPSHSARPSSPSPGVHQQPRSVPGQPRRSPNLQPTPIFAPESYPRPSAHKTIESLHKPQTNVQKREILSHPGPSPEARFNQVPKQPRAPEIVEGHKNKLSHAESVASLSYGQLLQEAQKITVNHENLKKIYQTNKLGESALRRLVVEKKSGHDLKKALNKEFIRKRLNPEKLPWNAKRVLHTANLTNGNNSYHQPTPAISSPKSLNSSAGSPSPKNDQTTNKPEVSKPFSGLATLIVILFAALILILILVLKRH